MPKWARLSTTSDASLSDRMASSLENGFGGEGPLAHVLARGGCFLLILVMSGVLIGGPIALLWWLGTLVF